MNKTKKEDANFGNPVFYQNQPKPAHTPTPWSYLPHYGANVIYKMQMDINKGPHKGIARTIKDADAAFIVRAVNAHEELLAALKHIHPSLYHRHKDDGIACRKCEFAQAIARAEGKS